MTDKDIKPERNGSVFVQIRFLVMMVGIMVLMVSGITGINKITVYAGIDVESSKEQVQTDDKYGGKLQEADGDLSGILQFGGLPEEPDAASIASANNNASREKALVKAVNGFSKSLNVENWGLYTSNVSEVVAELVNAHPEFVYIAKYSYIYNQYTGKVISLKFTYKPDARKEKKQLEQAIAKVNKEIKTKGMKPEEIVLAYHEYLTSTVAYDTSGAKEYDQYTGRDHMYDMYGTLVKRNAVCQGYAETMWYFLKMAGIPCGIASSQAITHAWNVVRINDKWYHVDATWDDPATDVPGQSLHDYFLLSFGTLDSMTKAANSAYSYGRYDTVISNVWKGSYSGAADTKYESGQFWNGVNKVICYRKGYWYSIKQLSQKRYYQISEYSFKTGKNNPIFTGAADWVYANGAKFDGQYGCLFIAQEILYFTTPNYVAKIDLEKSKDKASAVYDIRSVYSTGYNIYAMGYQGQNIVFWVSDQPGCYNRDAYKLDACMSHSWQKGDITKKPTFTSEGIQVYTCKKCGYTKNVSVAKLKLSKVSVSTQNTVAGVKLTWNTDAKAAGYKVYRKTGSGVYRLIRTVAGAGSRSMTDKKVSSGTVYTYRVAAYNRYTTGAAQEKSQRYIKRVAAKTVNCTVGVRVSWNQVKGAGSYKIYKKTGKGRFSLIKTCSSVSRTYVDKNVASGKTYTYYVRPYRGKTAGAYIKTTVYYLKRPTVRLRSVSNGIRVSWSKVPGAVYYKVYRGTKAGKFKAVKIVKNGKTAWTDSSAQKKNTYYYVVRAFKRKTHSAASAQKHMTR